MERDVSPSAGIFSAPTPTSALQSSMLAKPRESRKSASSTPAFLFNLGRATLRGIRRCPQCGVYNGTRGLSCKNKACGVSLRSASAACASRKGAVEAVKVVTDSEESCGKEAEGVGGLDGGPGGGPQVFSVCHRGRGASATQWGFVELVPTDTAIATGDGATLLTRINLGRCFLPSCRQAEGAARREGDSAAAAKQSSDSLCAHIRQAIECQRRATPLTFKSSVLDALQASVQAREELWRLATESPGPLVQRVSKDTLVVKCHADARHPLGLLHLTVGAAGPSDRSERSVFHCACQAAARGSKAAPEGGGGSGLDAAPPCLHFYACVCAFTSNDKLANEFAAFIQHKSSGEQQDVSGSFPCDPPQQAEASDSHHKAAKRPRSEEPSLGGKDRAPDPAPSKAAPRNAACVSGMKAAAGGAQLVDERSVVMGFHQWLAGVTERIHQTMHYQLHGKPDPLVYHIPPEFFAALQQRLSLGSKKRRLPNLTTAFIRNDGLPLGSLSKYTWHLTNLLHVRRVFDTPELPLEVTQSFVKNADGSYSRFRCPEPPPEAESSDGGRTQAIRPMELRTFLKVGPPDQPDSAPFVVEWTPDVLPRSGLGQLSISFQFGHQQSGQPERRDPVTPTEKRGRNKSECPPKLQAKAVEILQVVV